MTVAAGQITPDLCICKIEEWDHITAHVDATGRDIRRLPQWNEIPFFKGQKKIVLRNCGLINPDDIEEYIGVGGYQALYKVLIDGRPENVIEQIKASKLRGRGGAGYPDGQQVGVPGEGEGGSEVHHLQRGRGRSGRVHEPQRDRERSALAAGRNDHRRIRDGRDRGNHLCARGVSAGGAPAESRASSRRESTACWARTSWGADSSSTSSWWKAPARLSAAKRRR